MIHWSSFIYTAFIAIHWQQFNFKKSNRLLLTNWCTFFLLKIYRIKGIITFDIFVSQILRHTNICILAQVIHLRHLKINPKYFNNPFWHINKSILTHVTHLRHFKINFKELKSYFNTFVNIHDMILIHMPHLCCMK